MWRQRRVLVTGCTGVLGSWLVLRLLELGADVVGLVRDWVPRSQLVLSGAAERIVTVRGDVTDATLTERIFSEYEIETCFHLAAQTTVGIANEVPVPTFETNIRGTWLMLEGARRWRGLKQMIVASSDKAYGEHEQLPYTEQAALQGAHPYDVSKTCADVLTRAYAHTYGMGAAVTRCANMFAGGDLNWNRVVPGTMRSLLQGKRPVVRSDGSMRREYLYVKDVVAAYITLAEAMEIDSNAHKGMAYNFGLGQPISVLDLVALMTEISAHPGLKPVVENTASNDIQDQYLASDLAIERLGWRPQYSLRQGLTETMAWYREHLERSGAKASDGP